MRPSSMVRSVANDQTKIKTYKRSRRMIKCELRNSIALRGSKELSQGLTFARIFSDNRCFTTNKSN